MAKTGSGIGKGDKKKRKLRGKLYKLTENPASYYASKEAIRSILSAYRKTSFYCNCCNVHVK